VAVMGAGEDWRPTYKRSGMRDMYIGDEAIVDVQTFSLEGGRKKGLRQAVNRIANKGYTIEFHDPALLENDPRTRELAARFNDGLEVTLLWHPARDELTVCGSDHRTGARFEIRPERHLALEELIVSVQGLDPTWAPSVVCVSGDLASLGERRTTRCSVTGSSVS